MATTGTKTKKQNPANNTSDNESEMPLHINRKRQIRLGFGIFLTFFGAFLCYSVVSYYVSWTQDQDAILSSKGFLEYVFNNGDASNWGGRFGAATAHILVFRGAGIASLVIGLAVGSLGMHLLYGTKALPIIRYIRWTSIALLLIAPTLTYLFPDTTFPLGGALGNASINYFNRFWGKPGTGLALLGLISFFVFVVFALDLRPALKRLKEKLSNYFANYKQEPKFNKEPENISPLAAAGLAATPATAHAEVENDDFLEEHKETPLQPHSKFDIPFEVNGEPGVMPVHFQSGNRLKDDDISADDFNEEDFENEHWDLQLVEKNNDAPKAPKSDLPFDLEDDDWDEDEMEHEPEPTKTSEPANDFSFEVKSAPVEKTTIKHGTHISIGSNEPYDPELDLPDYRFPTLDLLEQRGEESISMNKDELEQNKDQIIQTLLSFGIEIQHISATIGPTVTLYEIVPAKGVRISKIKNLEDDIALSLAALGIRIIAPIPGKGTIGIEVPNVNKQMVGMQALLSSDKFVNNKMSLPIALGKKIDNENYIVDLATMPHLLMAGATGQGKSVGINAILVSLLYKKHPSQLKFVMVDPKKVELSIYRTIEKHFLAKLPNEEEPIITDIKKVIYTLRALCDEMDDRYGLLKDAGTRNIREYNEKFISRRLNPENGHKFLPFIVLVVDEFADLIMTAGKEVELPIARLAQLARAVGIHLIIATQRPSVNVITGTIKANFPARIAFKVSAKVDSRTILDTGGAEQLVGRGDMLISNGSELLRLQCAFVDTPEVENIVNFIGTQRGYPKAHPLPEPEMEDEDGGSKTFDPKNRDKLFEDCARTVVQMQSGSTSNLQRRFNLGYNRAGRIMDQLEAANIVGPAQGSKPREVYFKSETELEEFLGTLK